MFILWKLMASVPFFISFNIFHGHSITNFLVHKKILIVWKPTTFCNGFFVGFRFNKWIYLSLFDKLNDISGKYFHLTNYMFNPMRKYLVLFFNKMNFVCSVLFYWASYLPQWCSIRNTKNNVPFLIFITYIFQNPRSKWLPCPSNYSAGIISFFLSLSYNFKSSKCLSTFMWIFPDMLPLSENSTRQVTSPPPL